MMLGSRDGSSDPDMRIAFALDGIFADLELALDRLSRQVLATGFAQLTSAQRRVLWRVISCSESFWERLPETQPGAVASLARIAHERGWQVIFLVRRIATRGATPQLQSQTWLAEQGFRLPSVFVVDRAIADVAPSLDLDTFIDSPFEYPIEATLGPSLSPHERRRAASIGERLEDLCESEDHQTSWRHRRRRRRQARARLQLTSPPQDAPGSTGGIIRLGLGATDRDTDVESIVTTSRVLTLGLS